jgi:hypothetical protein
MNFDFTTQKIPLYLLLVLVIGFGLAHFMNTGTSTKTAVNFAPNQTEPLPAPQVSPIPEATPSDTKSTEKASDCGYCTSNARTSVTCYIPTNKYTCSSKAYTCAYGSICQ